MLIRPATPTDAPAIGGMHAQAWTETYQGIAPPALYAEMSDPARRRAAWARIIGAERMPESTFLAEEGGAVIGFINVCAAREAALGAEGEVAALYLLRRAQRRGIGTALLRRGAARLVEAGHRSAGAWVLDANAGARAFYAATGAMPGTSQVGYHGPHAISETAYIWHDLHALLP